MIIIIIIIIYSIVRSMCSSRLLWEVWLPVMRSSVSGWQPRSVGPMVDCVEVWAPLLPGRITEHLLEQLVMPRLQREARHTHGSPLHSIIIVFLLIMSSYPCL